MRTKARNDCEASAQGDKLSLGSAVKLYREYRQPMTAAVHAQFAAIPTLEGCIEQACEALVILDKNGVPETL